VCDALREGGAPERWHGEVVFAGQTLLRTGNVGSYDWADAAARTASIDRVRAVFAPTYPTICGTGSPDDPCSDGGKHMGLLLFAHHEEQVLVFTDTLATNAQGRPVPVLG